MAFTLPPDPQALDITITVPANLRPYFTEWYQATKLANDTPQKFILRQLKEACLRARAGVTQQETLAALQAEIATVSGAIG